MSTAISRTGARAVLGELRRLYREELNAQKRANPTGAPHAQRKDARAAVLPRLVTKLEAYLPTNEREPLDPPERRK